MPDIIVNQAPEELDSAVMLMLQPLVVKWEVAAKRVAASEVQPTKFSLAKGPRSIEQVLLKRFKRLPVVDRRRAGEKAVIEITKKKFVSRVSASLGQGAEGLISVEAAPMPAKAITKEQLSAMAMQRLRDLRVPPANNEAAMVFRTLSLKAMRVVCVDETNGLFGSEAGEDEIELGGIAIDETADVGKVNPFKVGNFNDGTRKEFDPPRTLVSFSLSEGTTFPKSYFATLIMVEADQGNFSDTVEQILDKVKTDAQEYLTTLIGAQIGTAGGPLGALVGAAIGYLVGRVFGILTKAWEDDPFESRTVELIMPSADATFNGKTTQESQVIRFKGPGEYALRYFWSLSR